MSKNIQQRLFDLVLQHFPKSSEGIDQLSVLLKVGRDGIYRRLRGETTLAPSELELLAKTFNISLDKLIFGQNNTVLFSFNGFDERTRNFNDYLVGFEEEMKLSHQIAGSHFYYASVELPLFQSCFFPELICFKLYMWGLTVLAYENLQNYPFSFDLLPAPILETIRRIQEMYVHIPSVELWGTNVIDNTLNQIEYHVESGNFYDLAEAILLCDKLHELTYHMQAMAAAGKKFLPDQNIEKSNGANFALYHNEMIYTSNTLLAVSSQRKILFTSLSNPHFLKTSDPRLCNYMEDWFKGVTTKSNNISIQSEKQRQWFFNHLRKGIEKVRNRINSK